MNDQSAICTLLLIGATSLISYLGFRSQEIERRYIFHPESILAGKEYHRLVTSAFLHANWVHLAMNMVSLYLFGRQVEIFLGKEQFLLVYFGSVVGGSLLSLFVHRHHEYLAYGASGGVFGIIFAYILLFPGGRIYTFPLPVGIPGWLYALAFIPASFYGMKTAKGNVGHDAHLGGAIVGLLITAGLAPWALRANFSVFLIVLISAALLLVYLWFNPVFLPAGAFFARRPKFWARFRSPPARRPEQFAVDDVLEKIARKGIESLTAEEKALLTEVSGKYRRRAESKKPDSGLSI